MTGFRDVPHNQLHIRYLLRFNEKVSVRDNLLQNQYMELQRPAARVIAAARYLVKE